MVEITPDTGKAILLRVALIAVAIGLNCTASDFTQNPKNNVFSQTDPYRWSPHIFLLLQLAELSIFFYATVLSEVRYGSAGMWCKICLFVFVISVCPAVCVMEHHRMSEVKSFYGTWHCTDQNIPENMTRCAPGNVTTQLCFRDREINRCLPETNDLIKTLEIKKEVMRPSPAPAADAYYIRVRRSPAPAADAYYEEWRCRAYGECKPKKEKEPFYNEYYVNKGLFPNFPQFHGLFVCTLPVDEEFGKCDVDNYTARIDQNNFWTYTCFRKHEKNDALGKICPTVKNLCRSKNVTDFYSPMKIRCRLAALIPFLTVTIVCWILPNYAPNSGKLKTLLLRNMLNAADVFDLFECFDDPLAPITDIWGTLVRVWSASLLHLFLNNIAGIEVSTSPKVKRPKKPADVESGLRASSRSSSSSESTSESSSGSESSSNSGEANNNHPRLLRGSNQKDTCQSNSSGQDAQNARLSYVREHSWEMGIMLSVMYLDLYFLWWRSYMLSRVHRYNSRIHFFFVKNILFIVVQAFRSFILIGQHLVNLPK